MKISSLIFCPQYKQSPAFKFHLNFSHPCKPSITKFIAPVEFSFIHSKTFQSEKDYLRDILADTMSSNNANYKPIISRLVQVALNGLKANPNLIITELDKEKEIVYIDRQDNLENVNNTFNRWLLL